MLYRRTKSGRTGFALIEVLFIVGIGALLLVMMFPVFSAAKRKSWKTNCMSNLRQIGMAMQLYAQDNDELLPPYMNRRQDGDGESSEWDDPESLQAALEFKVRDARVFFCNTDFYARRDVDVFGVNHKYSSYFFNLRPPDSGSNTLTISGVYSGGRLVVPPADYPLVRDANMGITDYIDGVQAKGCNHFGGVNVVYLDGHASWMQ